MARDGGFSMASSHDTPSAYAELHCLSNFTFLRGASHPEELVERAAQLGYHALALTDECSLAGVVRAHVAARAQGLKLIIGAEFKLADGPRLVLLATSRTGYGNLSQLITTARRAAQKGRYKLHSRDLAGGVADCLALLLPADDIDPAQARWLARQFAGCCWLAIELLYGPQEHERTTAAQALAAEIDVPLVAAGDVHMHVRTRRVLQDTLTAIRLGCTAANAGMALHPNGERHLRPREQLAQLYPAVLLAETVRIAERCRFSLDELCYEYPQELVPSGITPASHLRALTEAGMGERWPDGVPDKVRSLVEHELALIAELHYEPYFLTVHDIVRFARGKGILCQGRGSAANSAICYCLGVTEVDPARMSLLFERFISRERNEPPDIDVDFEHERREEVIQYLYSKYGRERAALAATVITYRPKSAMRDVGKALGLDLHQVDRLSKSLAWADGELVLPERLQEQGFDPDNPLIRRWLILANILIGFPRHLSQHVGGFVISQGPLSRLVPIENAAMAERTVIQWDKDDLDALGLLKVDVLALGMLSAIHRALDLVNHYRRKNLILANIPPEDPAVYAMLQRADTVGVFQIESRAQMAMLPRLKPKHFYDLVIEVALVRPGPIQGQMVHPYLRRRQGLEPVTYPNAAMRNVLERTLGVPIFQEQVMQVAMAAAGFTAGEADQLRRAMASWRRKGGLEPFQQRLRDGMRARGYNAAFAAQICRQVEGFAEYGFPESHAASFALLVYVSAWLKCHEPAAFTAALLNSQPMGFYAPAQLVQDAKRHGVEVRPVDARHSTWDCTLERRRGTQPALRLGLRLVKGLSASGGERLVAARTDASFASVEDLAARTGLAKHDLDCLAAAGVLESLAGHRHLARWQVLAAQPDNDLTTVMPIPEGRPLLRRPSEGEDIVADYGQLGLTLGRHPLALLRDQLARRRFISSEKLQHVPHGRRARAAGLVITRQRPGTTTGVTFLTLEDEYGTINVVVWSDLAERQRALVLNGRLLGVNGVVEKVDGVLHLVAARLEDHSALLGRLVTTSRDFC
jgi:error-prone DNA polymerase